MLAKKVNAGRLDANSRQYQEEISAELGWMKRDKVSTRTRADGVTQGQGEGRA